MYKPDSARGFTVLLEVKKKAWHKAIKQESNKHNKRGINFVAEEITWHYFCYQTFQISFMAFFYVFLYHFSMNSNFLVLFPFVTYQLFIYLLSF